MTDTIDEGTLHLSRTIPVPKSVSPEAQAVLATGGAMVASRLANPQVSPPLDDNAGWKARIAETDAVIALGFERVSEVDVAVNKVEVAGVDVYVLEPDGAATGDDAPIYYDIHGGALIAGGGDVCRLMGIHSATRAGLLTWAIDYRMPPDFPYPTPLDDCLAVYRALLEIRRPSRSRSVADRQEGTWPRR